MADATVRIYGFVNDTAFYNRNFDPSSKTDQIDQGACCMIDKVSQMFGEPAFIKDSRTSRCNYTQLVRIGETWTETDLKKLVSSTASVLDGSMSFVYDGSSEAITDEVKQTFKREDQMKALFSFLEIIGHFQTFVNDFDRSGLDVKVAESAASAYKTAAGNAKVISEDGSEDFVTLAKTNGINVIGETTTKFVTKRLVRKSVVISYEGVTDNGSKIPIELHVWWGRDAFIANYPLSTITDVIFPCEPSCLYELLDNYKTVAAFAEASSEYRSKKMDEVVAKNDHTGVYTFTTDYYAYPDTQPSNTFKLSFSCVYKGHVPTLEQVKSRLRTEVLSILPSHSEGEWRKKLPGIIADRQFFILPLYSNVWTEEVEGETIAHRRGIFDTTILATLIRKVMGIEYLDFQQYSQILSPRYSKYPTMVIPHSGNPESSRLISNLYPDYLGIRITETEEEGKYPATIQSANTQDFNTHFDDTLAKAAKDEDVSELAAFPGMYWAHFTPIDGTTYYILAKRSYPTSL